VDGDGVKTMTVYDNGSDRLFAGAAGYSRLVKLQLNEAASPKTARILYEYTEWNGDNTDPANWAEPFWGGYDEIDNGQHILAAQGHCSFCALPAGQGGTSSAPSHNSTLLELAPTLPSGATPLWKAVFASPDTMIYRAQHIDGCAIFNNLTYCPSLGH